MMTGFETSVRIERPTDDVFDYISDPQNFPPWNSAVRTVHKTSRAGRGRIDVLDGA